MVDYKLKPVAPDEYPGVREDIVVSWADPDIDAVAVVVRVNPLRVQLTVPDGGDTRVRITVQDATGREVLLILNGRLPADRRVQADLSDLASGAYMVVVQGAHGRSAVRLVRR